jgi:hypothetical protein
MLVSRSDAQGSPVNLTPGTNQVGVDLAQIPLLDGIYDLNVGVVDYHGNTVIAWKRTGRLDPGHLQRTRRRRRRTRRLIPTVVEASFAAGRRGYWRNEPKNPSLPTSKAYVGALQESPVTARVAVGVDLRARVA